MKGALTDHAEMSDKVHRDALVEVEIRRGIPVQIREMREARGWSQGQLGEVIGKPQNNISRMENTRDTYLSIKTLVEIASAFDVGLLVKFVPFSEVLRWTDNHSLDTVVPQSYSDEVAEDVSAGGGRDSSSDAERLDRDDRTMFLAASSRSVAAVSADLGSAPAMPAARAVTYGLLRMIPAQPPQGFKSAPLPQIWFQKGVLTNV
jgi:transcriptional regulator with XRE-family HTH domain